MRLSIALGIAAATLTVAAASAQSSHRVVIRHGGGSDISIDANEDGWITRAEASSAYERIFADLDTNHDGKLDDADRPRFDHRSDVRIFSHGDGDVRVITGDMDEETQERIEREVERAVAYADAQASRADVDAIRAEREAERAERQAERIERDVERRIERAERLVERDAEHSGHSVQRFRDGDREVIIIRTNGEDGGDWTSLEGDVAPVAPVPPVPPTPMVAPVPPVPPVPPAPFMMLIANSEEGDRNGDGALSREEFVAMHLRFFDASDANGDGRVRFEPPPRPPEPPAPPAPPEPPRRR